jgi:arsenite-transporting ATPase
MSSSSGASGAGVTGAAVIDAPAASVSDLAASATRVLFFTGKGGVGKTSVSCAVGVALADAGRRVLVVSTDPASNLDQVLETELADTPRPVTDVPGLWAANLDPEQAAAAYRETMIGPYRGVLPDAAVASMEEQLSGACTTEIAAFNEFARLVGDPAATASYDHVIFDTAPTGHTLRLLTLPSAWTDFIETNTTGNSCLGPLAGLQAQRELYARTVAELADATTTTLVLVSRPESAALREAARSSAELAELGVRNQRLILNGLFRATADDDYARALEARGTTALAEIPAALTALPRTEVPLLVDAPLGVAGLRALASATLVAEPGAPAPASPTAPRVAETTTSSLGALIDELEPGGHGVIMTMGKGGVGKTTIAAAIAVGLARRGHAVHLSTTDPAAHVTDALADLDGLDIEVGRIDPEAEVAAYRAHVLATAGAGLDAESLALLDEDLRSPCTEEIAVFRAFARTVARAADRFVVLDTAPTGHTILLLDSSEAYHREVMRTASDTPPEVLELLPRLRDGRFTRVLVVTLPEATPVAEAARLQSDLARAGIAPFTWVVNQSLSGLPTTDPVLLARGANERPYLDAVATTHATRVSVVPWQPIPPAGAGLLALLDDTDGSTT